MSEELLVAKSLRNNPWHMAVHVAQSLEEARQ